MMEENMAIESIQIKLSKILRKQKRCEKILEKNENIKCVTYPTKYIFIGNHGLICGTGCEELITAFQPFGQIEDIILYKNKSYSFIVFNNIEEAELAMRSLHGTKPKHMNQPLYLSYVDKVPSNNDSFKNEYIPPGLILIQDFLTEEQEEELMQCIKWTDLDSQQLKHRRVKHFGYEFNYKTNNIDKNAPLDEKIPEVCLPYLSRLVDKQYIKSMPDQLTVNYYLPGQGIPIHIDTHSAFEDGIVSISLGSQIVMEFYHPNGTHVPVLLPQRSALIMSKESRYLWSHGITPRKIDIISNHNGLLKSVPRGTRTSLTFRIIRNEPCTCVFPKHCDSQNREMTENILEGKKAKQLEETHVLQVYNEISDHFSCTRHKEWPKVAAFLNTLSPGSLLIDVGCGNGKYLGKHKNLIEIGCDFSEKLVKICRNNRLEVLVADNLKLPFRSEIADACISIAVLHHMATETRRITAMEELVRILKVNGKALIYVWAMEQKNVKESSNYLNLSRDIKVNKTDSQRHQIDFMGTKLPVHINRTQFPQQDVFVPWHKVENNKNNCTSTSEVYHRYYHVFIQGELEKLLSNIVNVKILESYYDQGNWCVVIEKIP